MTLFQAKTRVATLRQISLPRLALCAAALLVRLVEQAQSAINISCNSVHLCSDSAVTLACISGHPTRWTTFVANRMAEIQWALPDAQWHHVSSDDNPADCASRGIWPSDLLKHELWLHGPSWIRTGELCRTDTSPDLEVEVPERRTRMHVVTTPEESPLLLRFSKLQRLLRVTA